MKLWFWFLTGSIAGLLGASAFTPVDAGELAGVQQTWSARETPMGAIRLRPLREGVWELEQNLNRCTTAEVDGEVVVECTQLAPARYRLKTVRIETLENGKRLVFEPLRGQMSFRVALFEPTGASFMSLEVQGIFPGPDGVFEGAVSIDLK